MYYCVSVAGEREGWSAGSGHCAKGESCGCRKGTEGSVSSAAPECRGSHTAESREQRTQVCVF